MMVEQFLNATHSKKNARSSFPKFLIKIGKKKSSTKLLQSRSRSKVDSDRSKFQIRNGYLAPIEILQTAQDDPKKPKSGCQPLKDATDDQQEAKEGGALLYFYIYIKIIKFY